jgi:DNA polymerase III subunit gamma/tau
VSTPATEVPTAPASGYLGLARKWRPARFEQLVGQDAVAQSLARALEGNRLVQGHLLAGPRGVGKTTSARILARAVNCAQGPTPTPCGECRHCIDIAAGSDLDVIEIDAASNTGVDNMRELLEGTVRSPFSARYKVYIIDEVHMLSMGAFNALLKTLEEPPAHVVFIFATTELEKIPETIRSRCAVHRFQRLSSEDIMRRLGEVAGGEGLRIDPAEAREIYSLIAQAVDGGMRDALVAFDQLISVTGGAPSVEAARDLLGLSSQALLARTIEAVADADTEALLGVVEGLVNQGRSLERFVKGLVGYVHAIMVMQAVPGRTPAGMSGEILERTRRSADRLTPVAVFNLMNQLLELEGRLKQTSQPRFLIEFTFLRLAAVRPVVPIDQIIQRIQALPADLPAAEPSPAEHRASAPGSPRPYRREAAAPAQVRETPAAPPRALAASGVSVMADSGPAAPSPSASVLPEGALASLSRDELVDLIVPTLPEGHRFLGRYLKACSAMRASEGTLWIQWAKNDRVGSTMFANPANRAELENSLVRLAGRPMRVESSFGEEELPAPPRAAAPAPRAGAAAFEDSMPLEAYEATAEAGGFTEPDSAPAVPVAAAPALPHVTEPGTRALLQENDDFARRARMVRDFFEGAFVDHAGRPISA